MPTSDSGSIRIVIVDDHAILRAGLRMLIEGEPEMIVAGEAGDCASAFAAVAREKPDILLLDLDLGGVNSLDFLQDLLAASEGMRVIILTGVHNAEMHRRAVALGAMGLVLKEQAGETLIKAIKKVHAGEVWLDRSMMAKVLSEMTQSGEAKQDAAEAAKIAALTGREREVIALITEGAGTKQVAERLFISEKTVRNHLASIYSKLDLSDRLELVLYAQRHKLIKPPL